MKLYMSLDKQFLVQKRFNEILHHYTFVYEVSKLYSAKTAQHATSHQTTMFNMTRHAYIEMKAISNKK